MLLVRFYMPETLSRRFSKNTFNFVNTSTNKRKIFRIKISYDCIHHLLMKFLMQRITFLSPFRQLQIYFAPVVFRRLAFQKALLRQFVYGNRQAWGLDAEFSGYKAHGAFAGFPTASMMCISVIVISSSICIRLRSFPRYPEWYRISSLRSYLSLCLALIFVHHSVPQYLASLIIIYTNELICPY